MKYVFGLDFFGIHSIHSKVFRAAIGKRFCKCQITSEYITRYTVHKLIIITSEHVKQNQK